MQFQGALLREQGVTFAVVVVKNHVVQNRHEAEKTIQGLQQYFPGIPVVLMGQDARGGPTYFGRKDIARFLSNVTPSRIPWKRYTVA